MQQSCCSNLGCEDLRSGTALESLGDWNSEHSDCGNCRAILPFPTLCLHFTVHESMTTASPLYMISALGLQCIGACNLNNHTVHNRRSHCMLPWYLLGRQTRL